MILWSKELELTWAKMFMNCVNLLSSTTFSHTISRIQLNGFVGQVFRSRAAPPIGIFKGFIILWCHNKKVHSIWPSSDNYLTFNKYLKFLMHYFVTFHVDLESQQECEDELVVFIEASHCVSEHLVGQTFNEVGNSLFRFRRLLGPARNKRKNSEEERQSGQQVVSIWQNDKDENDSYFRRQYTLKCMTAAIAWPHTTFSQLTSCFLGCWVE